MKLKKIAQTVFWLWIVAMIVVWVFFHDEQQCVDANRFMRNAFANWQNGTLYPSRIDLHQDYITAVGYTNLLQLVHLVFGRLGWMQFINMAMNIGIVLEIFYIARRLFSPSTGYVAVTLYCLMTTNLFPFLQLVTEIPFLFNSLSAFTLCLKVSDMDTGRQGRRIAAIALLCLSGLLFAFAHTIRAVEMAFLVPSVVYLVYRAVKNSDSRRSAVRKSVARAAALLLPYAFVLVSVGLYFKSQTGVYVNRAMTGWYNFVMVSSHKNPVATGDLSIYAPGGYAYIPNWEKYTFAQRDSMYHEMGVRWVKEHPAHYLVIYGLRVMKFWGADYFYIPDLTGYDDLEKDKARPDASRALTIRRIVEVGYSAVYYVVFILFLIGIVKNIKERKKHVINQYQNRSSAAGWVLLLSVVVLGTAGTCLLPIEIRYHYPYTWAMTILAADALLKIAKNINWKKAHA